MRAKPAWDRDGIERAHYALRDVKHVLNPRVIPAAEYAQRMANKRPPGRPRTSTPGIVKVTAVLPEALWLASKHRAITERRYFRDIVIDALTVFLKTQPLSRRA